MAFPMRWLDIPPGEPPLLSLGDLGDVVGAGAVLLGYLIGSVCFGLVYAKRAGVDLRAVGSGNVGATNVGRALGKATGRKVLLLDLLKGLVPTLLANLAFGLFGEQSYWPAAVGFATAFGHSYPIYFGLRGGKAAATSAGAMLGLAPWAGVAALLVFVIVKKTDRRVSLASLLAALAGASACVIGAMVRDLPPFAPSAAMGAALLLLVVWRHRENIGRLRRGTEPRS